MYLTGYPATSIIISFFLNDTATTQIYTLSLHDALPILFRTPRLISTWTGCGLNPARLSSNDRSEEPTSELQSPVHVVCRLLLEKKKAILGRRRSLRSPEECVIPVGALAQHFVSDVLALHIVRADDLSLFFFDDTATTEIYTLSLHDALPIYLPLRRVAAILSRVRSPMISLSNCA